MKALTLIPHYNHPTAISHVTQTMRGFGLNVLIANDDSREECKPVLQTLVSDSIDVLYRPISGGKGAAVKTSLEYAREHDYTHALQVDADGQHCLSDTPRLLAAAEQNPEAAVCSWPQYGDDTPKVRLYGRKITNFWNILHTWSCDIKDGMCGFRLYPLTSALSVVREETVGDHMDFGTEILIRLCWCGIKPVWTKTPVQYAADGVSHFDAFADNVRISKMHTRLLFGMLKHRLSKVFGKAV